MHRLILLVSAATVISLAACDPVSRGEKEIHVSQSEIEEARAAYDAWQRHKLSPSEERASPAYAEFVHLMGETIELVSRRHLVNPGQHSIHETDLMLRARLDQYDHPGYAPQLKQSVGRLMLMDAIPQAGEDGLDRLRIGYVDLMLEGMSDEFLVIIDALEAVEGYDDEVGDLARRTLAHTHALEAAHGDKVALFATIDEEIHQQALHLDLPEGVTVEDLREEIDQMSDAERAQLVEEVRHEWPPRIIVPDGLSRVRPDMDEVRARLEALMR